MSPRTKKIDLDIHDPLIGVIRGYPKGSVVQVKPHYRFGMLADFTETGTVLVDGSSCDPRCLVAFGRKRQASIHPNELETPPQPAESPVLSMQRLL